MATVTTTTNANPLIYPSQAQIERVRSGDLWAIIPSSTANTYELWRSQNAGTTWTLALSTVRANVQEVGVIQCLRAPLNQLVWMYRTYESGQDRVYLRTISDLGAGSLAWNPELLVAAATAASAGDIYNGIDFATVVTDTMYVLAAVGSRLVGTGNVGVSLFVAKGPALAKLAMDGTRLSGPFYWVAAGSGRITPSVDIEHSGDGHSSATPHAWVAWGRTDAYCAKLSWTGTGWATPVTPVKQNPVTLAAQDSIAARWDGGRFCTAVPDPASTTLVTVFERNRANSTTTIRQTAAHPQGVVKNCAIGYNSVTGDLRVYAVGTTTAVLYYTDFIRASGTWSAWATVTATAIMGTNVNNYSIRRATNGRFEVLTGVAGSPNSIVHTAQSLSYTPNVPTWDPSSMQLTSGAAADVNSPLTLDWVFSDPDAADSQTAYAVSRQIGAGTLAYWRASDLTWQPAEVQNSSTSTQLILPPPWGAGTDAVTTFRVKTWDTASLASGYSDGFAVMPSTVVNPAITAPTAAQILNVDSAVLTWTAAEQSAWRARLWAQLGGDTFTGRTNSSSFGNLEYGGAWATSGGSGTDYNVASGVATMSVGSLNVLRTALADAGSTNHTVWADIAVNVASPTGAPVTKWVVARSDVGLANYYVAQISISTAGTVALSLQKRVAGVLSSVGLASKTIGYTHASGEFWRIVLDCQDDTIRCKTFRVTGTAWSEPDWQLSVSGETSITTGTRYGVLARVETGNTNSLPLTFTIDNVFAAGALAYDTGWLNTPVSTFTYPLQLPDLSAWIAGLRTRNVEALPADEQLVAFTIDYVEPEAATLTATPDPTNGVITVALTNASPVGTQPAVTSQDVYVRPNTAGANLLTNPGFETNTTGWTGTGGTLTRSTAQFHTGTAAGLLTPDGVTAAPGVACASTQLAAVVEGQTWTVDGWLRPATANKSITLAIEWRDVSSALVSTSTVTVTPIAGVWLYVQATFAVPLGVSVVKAGARYGLTSTPAVGDLLYGDDLRLRQSNTAVGTRVAAAVASGATVSDWRAASGVDYEYRALTRGANGTSIYGPWTA